MNSAGFSKAIKDQNIIKCQAPAHWPASLISERLTPGWPEAAPRRPTGLQAQENLPKVTSIALRFLRKDDRFCMPAEMPRRSGAPARPPVHAPSGMQLDENDLKLLHLLQESAREPIRTLDERIAPQHNSTLHRINRLEDSGAILRYMADIEEGIFGTWLFYGVQIALTQADRANSSRLEAAIKAAPEITEAAEPVGVFDWTVRITLQKPADWAQLQTNIDPSTDFIQTAHLHPLGRVKKQMSPHSLFVEETV